MTLIHHFMQKSVFCVGSTRFVCAVRNVRSAYDRCNERMLQRSAAVVGL